VRVRLLAYATAADALGAAAAERELAEGSTVADLTRRLAAESPRLAAALPRFAIAVDGALARPETALADGCEVALLPPVSGG
jgi:molybdopterin converting factor small subunit